MVVVILYHAAGLLPGGFAGVDVFFVISGFVITRSLVSEHQGTGRISLRDFYRRRVQRLTPALVVTLVVVMPLSVLFAPIAAVRTTIATGAAATVLAANIALAEGPGYFDLGAESNPSRTRGHCRSRSSSTWSSHCSWSPWRHSAPGMPPLAVPFGWASSRSGC